MGVDVYEGLLVNRGGTDGDTILYEDRIFYRYMDKIYIPNPPSELSKDNVKSLSKIRIDLNEDVIDLEYSKKIINHLIECSGSNKKESVLDFGCGGGLIADVVLDRGELSKTISRLFAVDISEYAVKKALSSFFRFKGVAFTREIEYFSEVTDEGVYMNIDDEEIDLAISSFAMHFNIYESQINEIYRVVKKGGAFIYNDYVYNKYPAHSKNIIKMLKDVGFEVKSHTFGARKNYSNEVGNHLIVKAEKL